MLNRRLLFGLLALVLVLAGGPSPVAAQRVGPGGAPPPGSGPFDVKGFIRPYDGDTFEAWIDGKRTIVGLEGIATPQGNTPCGRDATARLRALVKSGLHLDEDSATGFDARGRRMYHATTGDGKSLEEEMVRTGVVRTTGRGDNRDRLAAAESDASNSQRGCVWQKRRASAEGEGVSFAALSLAALTNPPDAGQVQVVAAAPANTNLPNGFAQDVVASGLQEPTVFAFLPDGRILIGIKNGSIRVVKNGTLLPAAVMDISDRVNDYGDRGILGLAVDSSFATNGFICVSYTYETNGNDFAGPKTGRISRFTMSGDTANPNTEQVLIGTTVGTPAAPSCKNFPKGADCIASDSPSHSLGNLKFAPDGTLYAIFGDGSSFNFVDDDALRSQDVDVLSGKLLHITTTGQGLSTNPFWNGNPNANRSKVWAYGLRNPYRFNFRPGTSVPFIGDVGWNNWEEIDVGVAGANYGWPCYEGNGQQSGYAVKSVCQSLYGQGTGAVKMPLVAWSHQNGGAASTGGAFYTGSAYPGALQGAYVYGDYAQSWMRSLRVDASNNLVANSDTGFATLADGPVDIEAGPDTNLYYLAINAGELRRLRYTLGNTPPTAKVAANPTAGGTPLAVQFSSSGSGDADGDPLTYSWSFGDNTPNGTTANPQHTYSTAGTYTAKLTVSDGRGGTATDQVTITAGNSAPKPTINAPSASLRYKVGDVITYSGSATDAEDGTIPASGLTWNVTLKHCPGGACHTHPIQPGSGAGGTITVDDHGDDTSYELTLTAKDSGGLTASTSMSILPQTVQVTLATSPSGLQVVYDGTGGPAPLTKTSIVNSKHTITAPTPQNASTFKSWSDNGAAQHNVTLGASNVTYTATFDGPKLLVGDQTIRPTTDTNSAGQAEAFQYTAAAAGTVNKLFVYLDANSTATRVVVGLYANGNGDTVGTLLTQGMIQTPAAGTWNSVDVPAANVVAGTKYWLAVMNPPGTGAIQFRDTDGGGLAQSSAQTNLTTMPSTWSAGQNWFSTPASIYAAQFGTPAPDTTVPTVSLTAPAGGSTATGASVTVSANASDNVGVTSVQFLLDGQPLGSPDAAAPYSITWDSRTANNGPHTLGAQAKDAASNTGTATTVSVTVSNAPPPDTTAPTVTTTGPTAGATGVPVTANIIAAFSEAMNASTLSTATFTLVKQGTTTPVAAAVTYATATNTATLDPTAILDPSTTYTATLKGGASGAKDVAGNALAADKAWTFTTAAAGPVTLVGVTTVGTNPDNNPSGMAEAFLNTATTGGTATKLFVYVDSTNTANQIVVGLYSNATGDQPGTLLGQSTIASPTKGAWNSATISPVAITAGTKYWIAVLGPAGGGPVQFRDGASGGKAQTSAQTNLTTLPTTWSSGIDYPNAPMSAYAAQ